MGKLNIDHARINAAITRAEATTSGEITCVLKARAMDYGETPLAWGFGTALVLPLILALFGIRVDELVPVQVAGWQAAHATLASYNHLQNLAIYGLFQLLIFGVVYLVVRFTALKLWLTPRSIKHRKAREKATEQFYARGLHKTESHTGVMIFCALEEHFVAVIADSGIHARVDQALWKDTVAALLKHIKKGDLTSGFEAAVALCGDALTQHFPAGAENRNELPDVLIEI
ncbi:TPM domain-containing protein [Asticcacaulis sp. EMRT-3]|uniref:TPM domain-containing protein n=1 Tax=Asticcacaulis sp. EMRT-3 TaxID=3040349 RepID=UPI0024AF2A65|nr:TPM domain-containing protein [Asticcacaulis sp. EMRT-3]MDI7775192.1 TPM domain-containing protein [Asticcacaulis sp. EMRT-3]